MPEPAYLDFHVHVGEDIGGYTLRDGFSDLAKLCSKAADPDDPPLKGIGAFVTQAASQSLATCLQRMRESAQRYFPGQVFWHLTPVSDAIDEVLPLLGSDTDLKFYTTYKPQGLYKSYREIAEWMEALSSQKTRILVHCEDDECVAEYSARHPFRHPHDHCLRRPEIAEIVAVEKILELSLKHKHPVHIVHVSSPRAALLIKEAKKHFQGITCETAPHYLLQSEDDLKGDKAHRMICTPPFRSEQSRGMMGELLQDDVFDILASDHCAFTNADKDRYRDQPEKVPCGIEGIGTLFTSINAAFVRSGRIKAEHLRLLTRDRVMALMNILSGGEYGL